MLNGGPLEWLIFGLEKVDPKIKRIAELNEVMAYRPWVLNKDHLGFLLKSSSSSENWTIQELLKASIILATYHGFCGFCHGMGLVPDRDIEFEMLKLFGPETLELTVIP